ncbi:MULTISPECIES: inner membrane protein YpjD [unclassified Halomonas]|uniref:cytochrome C assembly family protein n=1 Tax=unclassified Halomonas TaxID=2609666 RepID=UPI00209FEC97|nr:MULTISPECIES: cytochrome c biogenesis protein CcsA [unclassified Halomonas]MCP1314552.1 cytochrome c biogenesis protein CcsA [Halomonas sp. 707D7]MCP1327260.1 cytochrome c biogenesis protein CcsA [Halomonas sp. 707D4]
MQALPLATIAFVLYIAAAVWQGMTLFRRVPPRRGMVRLIAALGLLLHIPVVVMLINQTPGLLPGFTTSATLLMAVVVNVLLVASLFKPVLNAGIALFPLAGVALIFATWLPSQGGHTGLTPGILIHAASSALAFAMLAIAAVQAVLVGLQNQALRHHHIRGIVQSLPPLTTMERVLFELIWAGVALLTLSIASGLIFLDNLFAQHLVHKTVLSIAAWGIFTTLLVGRYRFGWRGMRAVRWTLGGGLLLVLAYFGSKFVLEIVLAR